MFMAGSVCHVLCKTMSGYLKVKCVKTIGNVGAVLFLLVAFGLSGYGQGTEGLSPDMRRVIENKKIVVAVHCDDGAPFYSLDPNGKLIGLDVDLARDIAKTLGVEVEFNRQAKTFDELVDFVAAGKADMAISCLSRTRKRAVKVNFSQPYLRLHHTLIINRMKTEKIKIGKKPAEWLNSPKVSLCTVKGSSYVEYVQGDYPAAQLVQYETFDEAAANVVKGNMHAVIFDDAEVNEWVRKHPEEVLYVQTQVLTNKEDNIAIALNWKDTHLLNWINLYLESYQGDAIFKAVHDPSLNPGAKINQ